MQLRCQPGGALRYDSSMPLTLPLLCRCCREIDVDDLEFEETGLTRRRSEKENSSEQTVECSRNSLLPG